MASQNQATLDGQDDLVQGDLISPGPTGVIVPPEVRVLGQAGVAPCAA